MTCRRLHITHWNADLREKNFLLDKISGEVVSIVGWDYHTFMPACMSVAYPILDSPVYRPFAVGWR